MPNFFYRAKSAGNEDSEGLVQAPTIDMAADILIDRGLTILWIKPTREGMLQKPFRVFRGVKAKDRVIFSRQLSVLITANIPLVQALKILVKQTQNKKLKVIVSEITDDVEGGAKLSASLRKHDQVFDNFYISLIRTGETSGKLDEVLSYLADQQEKEYELTSKIRGAMLYPVIILSLLVVVGALMMVLVVPKLTGILLEANIKLPLTTRMLISVSNFFQKFWWLLLIALIGFIFGVRYGIKTKKGRRLWDFIKLKIPIFGSLFQKIIMVRMSQSLQTLIAGGVALPEALRVTSDVVDNEIHKEIVLQTIKEVEDGNSISTVFAKRKEVPFMVSQMLNIGEKTGRLEQILEKLSEFYSREIDNMLRNLVTLVEPITLVFIGVGVGMMIAAIIMPIYNLSSAL